MDLVAPAAEIAVLAAHFCQNSEVLPKPRALSYLAAMKPKERGTSRAGNSINLLGFSWCLKSMSRPLVLRYFSRDNAEVEQGASAVNSHVPPQDTPDAG